MDSTRFQSDPREVMPSAACAYEPLGGGWRHTGTPVALPGSGALFTTVGDLDLWLAHLHQTWQRDGTALPAQDDIDYQSADHEPYIYGPGLYADPRPGHGAVFHYGHEQGFSAATHITHGGLRIACLSNTTDIAADHAVAATARALHRRPDLDLDDLLPLAVADARRPAQPAAEPRHDDEGPHRELGRYACDQVPGVLRLTSTGETLYLWRRGTPDRLIPASPSTWVGDGYHLTLPIGSEEIDGFVLDLHRAPDLAYTRLPLS